MTTNYRAVMSLKTYYWETISVLQQGNADTLKKLWDWDGIDCSVAEKCREKDLT
jgi:hypothetical protein